MIPDLITFSDTAKYADAGRSMIETGQYVIHHSFFDPIALQKGIQTFPANFPPLPSMVMGAAFSLFGSSDRVIIGLGIFFYLLLLLSVFCLASHIFSKKVGLLATVLLVCDRYYFFYAQNFTPEILLAIWIILAAYFLTRPGYQKIFVVIPLILSFLTKQQYSVVLAAVVISVYFQITRNFSLSDKLKITGVMALLVAGFIGLGNLNVASNLSPIKAMYSANMMPGVTPGDYLRGEVTNPIGIKTVLSKLFYNLYNFAKDPTRITSLFIIFGAIFALSFQSHKKHKIFDVIVFAFVLLILLTIASAISLPNARYIHPVTPLLCVIAAAGLLNITDSIKHGGTVLILLVFISIIPTIGMFTLDKRYEMSHQNIDKPSSVKVISQLIDEQTDGGLILTNLDAWGAWYNRLNTMWFPLSMNQLEGFDQNVKYIAITDYNSQDADFRLNDWADLLSDRNIKNNPVTAKYVMIYREAIKATEVRENAPVQIIILKHK
jgi:4-amino-4-deoxy-L-arabinose transferase-like glycosyltransferase